MHNFALSFVRCFALVLFFGLWAFIGVGDWRRQKVAQKSLLYGLAGAGLGYLLLLANTALGISGKTHEFHLWIYYYTAAIHVGVCASAALAFWALRIWPAGDAKLFICLALLYPLADLSGSFAQSKLVLVILINTFIPPAIFLFFKAGYYIFDTRLRHGREFLIQLGWKRELSWCWTALKEALGRSKVVVLSWVAAVRESPGSALAGAKSLSPLLLQWLMGMASMALVSYYLQSWVHSPMSLSLLCMGLFLLWNQVSRPLGATVSRLVLGGGVVCLWALTPHIDWRRLWSIFGNISVFSFFMFLGMNWAMKLMAGGWAILAQVLLPFLFMAAAYVMARLWGFFSGVLRGLSAALKGASWHGPAITAAPLHGVGSILGNAASWFYPFASVWLPLAVMGAFFGLSLALVRKWDEEVRPSSRAETLEPFAILAPEFVDVMRVDAPFFEEHFRSLYADGLTREQVDVLKVWCKEHSIEMIPLTPTISFASWIFLGFMLSSVLRGGHVLEVFL